MDEAFEVQAIARTFPIVSNAASLVKIQSNPKRIGLIIGNVTAAVIFVNFTDSPPATGGIPIPALSGSLAMWREQTGNALTGEIWVLMGGASVTTFVTEFIVGP